MNTQKRKQLYLHNESAINTAARVLTSLMNSPDENIALKASKEVIDYNLKVASHELDVDKYEKPASQNINLDVKIPNTIEIKLV